MPAARLPFIVSDTQDRLHCIFAQSPWWAEQEAQRLFSSRLPIAWAWRPGLIDWIRSHQQQSLKEIAQ